MWSCWPRSSLHCEVHLGKVQTTSLSSASGWNAVDIQLSRIAGGKGCYRQLSVGLFARLKCGLIPVASESLQ